MASAAELKHYLACWFQLGKAVICTHPELVIRPRTVMLNGRYSLEFQSCWRHLQLLQFRDCYLEGATVSLASLLENRWDLVSCARCQMPVMQALGATACPGCPCADLESWPCLDLPAPHSPLDTEDKLSEICARVSSAPLRALPPVEPVSWRAASG